MTTTGKTFLIIGSIAAAGAIAFFVFKAVSPPPKKPVATSTPLGSMPATTGGVAVGDIAVKVPLPGLATIPTTYVDPAIAYGSGKLPLASSIGAGIL